MQRRTKSIFSCNTDLIVCLTDKICSTGKEHTITGCGLSATESLVCDDCVCTVWSITLFNLFRRKRKVKCQHYLVEISQCGLMNKKTFFWIWWLSYLVDQGGRKQALLSGVNSHYLLPNAGRTERSHQTTASPETCPTGEDRSTSARASGQGRLKLHDTAAEWPWQVNDRNYNVISVIWISKRKCNWVQIQRGMIFVLSYVLIEWPNVVGCSL